MRSYAPLAALFAALCAAPALAQVTPVPSDAGALAPDAGPQPTDGGSFEVPAASTSLSQLRADILKEVQAQEDVRMAHLRDELKDEIRAELTTAQAPAQEFEELPEEKPKLQFLELNGYFRVRPALLQNMGLGWTQPDPLGYYPYPHPFSNPAGKTDETTDMRFRIEPTLNVSEDIRIKGQIDVLDNLVLGSTPDLSSATPYTILNQSQVPPSNSLQQNLQNDSIRAKRLWAEVNLPPIGQLRFGRMGNQWGLGIYQNDGNCLDCDYGNTVDRIALVLKIANHYIIPMVDWVGAGALYNLYSGDQLGQPVSFDRLLEAYQYGIQVARRDTDEELKALADQGKPSVNYGFYGTIRQQDHDLVWNGASGYGQVTSANQTCASAATGTSLTAAANSAAFNGTTAGTTSQVCGVDARNATFYVPDVWARLKTRRLRLETELVYVNGSFTINQDDTAAGPNNVNHKINENAFGGAVEADYKFLSDLALTVGFDAGLATGNHSYGFGNQPGRSSAFSASGGGSNNTPQGSFEGSPIYCPNNTEPCARSTINAFNFSPDYRVDQILWRQILGGVVDAFYLKPSIRYRFFEGLDASLSAVYSQAMLGNLTPGGQAPLGLEGDVGIHYHTDDGFIAALDYGILLPFGGLNETIGTGAVIGASVAQSFRLFLGVKY